MAEVAIQVQVTGATQAVQALTGVQQSAQRLATTTNRAFSEPRQAIRAFSVALSSVGSIIRLTGKDGEELSRKLESISIVLFTATAAVSAFRGAVIALPAILTAIRVALVAMTGPIGLLVAAAAALAVGIALVVKRMHETQAAAQAASAAIPPVSAALDALAVSGFDAAEGLAEATIYMLRFISLAPRVRNEIMGIGLATQGLVGDLDVPSFQELTRLLSEFDKKPKAGVDKLAQSFADAVQEAELFARINKTTNADLANQLQAIHDRFERIPGAAKKLRLELLALQAQIVELREEVEKLELFDPSELERLRMFGREWEGVASEAERAMGRLGKSTVASLRDAQTVIDETNRRTEGLVETIEDAIRRLIRAGRGIADQFKFGPEDFDIGLDRVQQQIDETRQELLDLARVRVDFAEQQVALGKQDVSALIQAAEALRTQLELQIALLGPTAERVRLEMELLGITTRLAQLNVERAFRARFGEFVENARDAFRGIEEAFQGLFTDLLTGAKTLTETIADFFSNMANAIIAEFAKIAARWAAMQLWQGLGLPLPFQRGGELIATRPQLIRVGERPERVTISGLEGSPPHRGTERAEVQHITHNHNWYVQTFGPQQFADHLIQHSEVIDATVTKAMRKGSPLGRMLGGASTA